MKNFWKRLGSAGVATALCLGMAQAVPAAVVSAADPLFSAECEDLTLSSDAQVATKVYNDEYPGYTGAGFVWVTSSGTMSFTIDAPETGMYRLMTLVVNAVKAVSWAIKPVWSSFPYILNRLSALVRQPVLWEEWHAKRVRRLYSARLPDSIRFL